MNARAEGPLRRLGDFPHVRSGTPRVTSGVRLGDMAMGAMAVGFAVLAHAAQHHPYFAVDLEITRSVQAIHAAWIVRTLDVFSAIGFPPVVDVVYGLIALALFVAGRRREGLASAAVAGGAAALNFVAKAMVDRPRPSPQLVEVAHAVPGTSFPAGHVLNAGAFLGFLGYLAWIEMKPSWRRTGVVALLVIVIGGMGLARIHSGEHWPSDVLGGYMLGGMWWYVCVRVYARLGKPPRHRGRAGEVHRTAPRPEPGNLTAQCRPLRPPGVTGDLAAPRSSSGG